MLAEVGVEPLPTDEAIKQKCSAVDHSAILVICVYNTYTLCRHFVTLFVFDKKISKSWYGIYLFNFLLNHNLYYMIAWFLF